MKQRIAVQGDIRNENGRIASGGVMVGLSTKDFCVVLSVIRGMIHVSAPDKANFAEEWDLQDTDRKKSFCETDCTVTTCGPPLALPTKTELVNCVFITILRRI
jgi:hypothetical protein